MIRGVIGAVQFPPNARTAGQSSRAGFLLEFAGVAGASDLADLARRSALAAIAGHHSASDSSLLTRGEGERFHQMKWNRTGVRTRRSGSSECLAAMSWRRNMG